MGNKLVSYDTYVRRYYYFMKIYITKLFIILAITSVFSQEKVVELNGIFSQKKHKYRDSYALINQNNKDLAILAEEGNFISLTLLNSKYENKSRVTGKPLSSKYENMIGYSIHDNIYNVFYMNDEGKKFASLQFNVKNFKVTERKINLKFKFERYLESIVYNNNIYIFSISRNSSNLNIYTFNEPLWT